MIGTTKIGTVNVADIHPSGFNARVQDVESSNSHEFLELCESIKSEGLIEPIVVRFVNGKYEAVAGSRRLRALKHLGVRQTSVIIRDMTDNDVRIASLVENIHRGNLTEPEKQKTLNAIYKESWNEWKPLKPTEHEAYLQDKGGIELVKAYLKRMHNQKTRSLSPKKTQTEGHPITLFPTPYFRDLASRVGYAYSAQYNILRGYGTFREDTDYVEDLPAEIKQIVKEDPSLKHDEKLQQKIAHKLSKKFKKPREIEEPEKLKRESTAKKKHAVIAQKMLKTFKEQIKEPEPKWIPAKEKSEAKPELEQNAARARGEIIMTGVKLFKALSGMDLNTGKVADGEMQAKSIEATRRMKEIATYYITDRELATLQCTVIPVNIALSIFRDMVYDAVEAEKRKGELFKP